MALDLSFAKLADIAQSGGGGRPVEIPLDQIIEDPDQPRRVFDEAELNQLAASIKARGVLQAISVRPRNAEGKHVIIFGARRYRASRLAGRDRIRAVIEDIDAPEPYIQLIENIQRDDLRPVEIAAFVAGRLRAGDKAADIADRLGKGKDWVSRYAAVAKMPDFLQAKLETSPIRAVYELYQAWRDHPDEVERLCREHEAFADAQARVLVQALRMAAETRVAERQEAAPAQQRGDEVHEGSRPHEQAPTLGGEAAVEAEDVQVSPAKQQEANQGSTLETTVRRLERALRRSAKPAVAALLPRYEALVPQFEKELTSPREVLLSRRAALMLIKAAADDA